MKRKLAWILAALLVLALLLMPLSSIADLGDFSGGGDYGGGGGSDWGGSDWGGSDSDSGGGTGELIGCAISMCIDYGCSHPGAIPYMIGFVVLVAIGLWLLSRFGAKHTQASRAPGATRTEQSKLQPMSAYAALDPNFSEEDMKQRLSNLYIKMQDCCTKRDVEPIRPYFADSLWQQFNRQVQRHKQQGITNYVDRIAVLDVRLRGFYQENGQDVLIAELYTRITDYTLSDADGSLVTGSRTAEKFMNYEYALSRPSGKTTQEQAGDVHERHCPNCGAPLSVNESIKCPYCGSVLTFTDHEWTVHAIKGISQRTVGK